MEKVSPDVKRLNKEDFSNICRLCLVQGPMASIFELTYEESSFPEILLELFSTQVNSEDELPKNVCETCISQIICFYNFRKIVVASEKTLQAIITKELNTTIHRPILCDEEIKLEDFIHTISRNDLNEDIIEVKKELVIDKTFESNDQELRLEDQIINVNNSNEKNEIQIDSIRKVFLDSEKILQAIITKDTPISCDNDIFKSEDFVNIIISNDDLIDIKEDPDMNEGYEEDTIIHLDSSNEDEITIDTITTSSIDTIDDFLIDSKDSKKIQEDFISETVNIDLQDRCLSNGVKRKRNPLQPKIFNCSCQKTFTVWSEYIKHRKEVKHPRTRHLQTCKICDKNFNKGSLKEHMRTHTQEKPYECKICSERFSLSGNLNRHMMRHTGKKPHVCEFCGKGFIQGPTLTAHKRIHTGEKPYVCEFCGKRFIRSSHLITHKIIHTVQKPFLCTYCGKTYSTSVGYKRHLNKHHDASKRCDSKKRKKNEKSYMCEVCGKSFKGPHLRAHKRTHTGEKPFQCTTCLRTFNQIAHLISHLRTHSGERPYACPHCYKAFTQSGNLRVHIRTHTGETPYMCDLCPRGFYDSSSLKKHRKRHLEGSKVDKKGD